MFEESQNIICCPSSISRFYSLKLAVSH